MSLRFYMDVHVPAAITRGLRRRGIDVLTAQDDGAARLADPDLLDRALALSRIVFTRDDDFLSEAVRRQRSGTAFASVVYAHQLRVSIGRCLDDLILLAEASRPEEETGQIVHLPL